MDSPITQPAAARLETLRAALAWHLLGRASEPAARDLLHRELDAMADRNR